MTFPSVIYGVFLLSVFAIYWAVEQEWLKLWMLLIASVIFYSSLQPQYIPLLFVITLINYYLGIELRAKVPKKQENLEATGTEITKISVQDQNSDQGSKTWRIVLLIFGISLNVLLLLSFKYIPFLLTIIGNALKLPIALTQANWIDKHITAPLGLSFFCFECIAYLVDVYRGAPASQNFLKFSAYKLFFPKLMSGPITRYHQFINQLPKLQFPNAEALAEGLWLIAFGAVKKALVADRLANYVNLSFDNLIRAGSGDIWLATFAYGWQLYLDFSGYVDIVRGSAILLGLQLPENFDYPYFSTSIADFWRRWHISLGDWLRNYLYFPLGGSRKRLARTCFNLLIVMLIAGIWHGAAWGFIVWGILHGIALAVHRLTTVYSQRHAAFKSFWQTVPGIVLAWGLTQLMVFLAWIFFRLPNLKDSTWAITHLWGQSADPQFIQKVYLETLGLTPWQFFCLLAVLTLISGITYTLQRGLKLQLNWPLKLLLVPTFLYAVWQLAPQGVPFIYFDF